MTKLKKPEYTAALKEIDKKLAAIMSEATDVATGYAIVPRDPLRGYQELYADLQTLDNYGFIGLANFLRYHARAMLLETYDRANKLLNKGD